MVAVPRWVLDEVMRQALVAAALVTFLRDHGGPQPRAFPDDESIRKGDRAIAAAYDALNGPMPAEEPAS